VIHIPYAWSNFALFEFGAAGLVTLVPSTRFFLELMSSCIAWGTWLCDAIGTDDADQRSFELWFQDFQHVQQLRDLEDAEWWTQANRDLLVYFDSWEELQALAREADFAGARETVRAWSGRHVNATLRQWSELLL